MAFDRDTRRRRAVVWIAALLLSASAALAAHWPSNIRAWVVASLVAIGASVLAWRALQGLSAQPLQAAPDPAFGLPADLAASREAMLALEAQQEHAPVALWRREANKVVALNNAARKLLAPGRSTNSASLMQCLQNAPENRRTIMRFDSEHGQERALLAAQTMVLAGQETQLLALMPIESELEAETLTAWRQLVHVLTHEIMNSLTPIASLSRTAQEMLQERYPETVNGESDDLVVALDAISRRATHLASFVGSYRRVSDMPAPTLEAVSLQALFARVQQLVSPDWQARGGTTSFTVEPTTLELMTDPGQLEQALINLIKNAAEATANVAEPAVKVSAQLVRGGRLTIEVSDNGPGVPEGVETRIFTPFFSTRAQGSGIGLAVVRSLIHGMGGTIRYAKRPSGGACFVLAF